MADGREPADRMPMQEVDGVLGKAGMAAICGAHDLQFFWRDRAKGNRWQHQSVALADQGDEEEAGHL